MDFGMIERELELGVTLRLMKAPAPLACYWLGKLEFERGATAAVVGEQFAIDLDADFVRGIGDGDLGVNG